ncbi:MAG: hypothetical protein ABI873_18930 [Marmoricola sp.]
MLRRAAAARAIQGSNTIEGYTVTDEDDVAAVDGEPPLSAEATWAEIVAYRRVLTYVLNVAAEPDFVIDEVVLRSMHLMLLEHDLTKSPGRYSASGGCVRDDRTETNVYEGPGFELVPDLVRALQTMVLAQDQVVEPTFSSIEEWLGSNTQHHYDVLAAVGRGSWQPENDATLWVKFNLRAHHVQAQTMRRRFDEAETQWAHIDRLITQHRSGEAR